MQYFFVNQTKATNLSAHIFSSLEEAVSHAENGTCIVLQDKEYALTQTLSLCGRKNIRLEAENHAVFHSLTKLPKERFCPVGNGAYTYQFPESNSGYPLFRDLYCNGEGIPFAHSASDFLVRAIPDEKNRSNPENKNGLYINTDLLENPAAKSLYPMEIFIHLQWEAEFIHAERVDLTDTIFENGKTYCRMLFREEEFAEMVRKYHNCLSMKGREYYFRNHASLVKKPGEFAYDFSKGALTYFPKDPDRFADEDICYPTLTQLIDLSDSDGISFYNITFTGTTNTYGLREAYCSYQANTMAPNVRDALHIRNRVPCGAIYGKNVKNCTVSHCEFTHLGTNGVILADHAEDITIEDSSFDHIAMSALAMGNASTQWDEKNSLVRISIHNNRFRHIAYRYPTAPCITILPCDELSILHNDIADVAYSGISVGWGWNWVRLEAPYGERINVRNAEIAYNRFAKFMQVMRDGGGIYVVGPNAEHTFAPKFNAIHDNFFLRADDEPQHEDRGIYLDGSSSNWYVYNNVGYGCHLPIFIQYHVVDQYTHNNFTENNFWALPHCHHAIPAENHVPTRNVILGNCYDDAATLEELFEKYPAAKIIAETTGNI